MDVTSGVLERLSDPTLLPRLSGHFIKDVHASLEFILVFPIPKYIVYTCISVIVVLPVLVL